MERAKLEKPASICEARMVAKQFHDRNGEFSDADVHQRIGIAKDVIEEYLPLLRLAQTLKLVRSIRLFPQSNQGPDGEIRFWWRYPSKVQITCAAEDYQTALMREKLANNEPVFRHQSHCRKNRERIEASGIALIAPEADVKQRQTRILAAIDRKENNYYPGIDTLLVLDELANFMHLSELHNEVCRTMSGRIDLSYKRIFVVYGIKAKRVY